MCGIAGIIDYEHPAQTMCAPYVQAMQETLRRRGPDQKGIWKESFVTLIHSRLSIVDLEGGRQPMMRGSCCIVYNGELYNTQELRAELLARGRQLSTHSDTEVILQS